MMVTSIGPLRDESPDIEGRDGSERGGGDVVAPVWLDWDRTCCAITWLMVGGAGGDVGVGTGDTFGEDCVLAVSSVTCSAVSVELCADVIEAPWEAKMSSRRFTAAFMATLCPVFSKQDR